MARVSRFSEDFNSVSNFQNSMTEAHSTTKENNSSSALPTMAGKAMKAAICKPYHGLGDIKRRYKQHFKLMINTNITSKQSPDHDGVDAGSTPYGCRPASKEELRKQSERNYLDYIFYLGPDDQSTTTLIAPPPSPNSSSLDSLSATSKKSINRAH